MNPPFVGDLEVCVKAFAEADGTVIDVVVIRRLHDERRWHLTQSSFNYPATSVEAAILENWAAVSAQVHGALKVDALQEPA